MNNYLAIIFPKSDEIILVDALGLTEEAIERVAEHYHFGIFSENPPLLRVVEKPPLMWPEYFVEEKFIFNELWLTSDHVIIKEIELPDDDSAKLWFNLEYGG